MFSTLILTTVLAASQFPIETVAAKQEITIEQLEHTPIVFQFDIEQKDGWETTDKIHPLNVEWNNSDKLNYRTFPGGNIACWAPAGVHVLQYKQILINWTKQDIDQREFIATIKVIAVNPPDPNPTPDPTPDPTPEPTPDPIPVADNPFPTDGSRVLVVEDSTAHAMHTPQQRNIMGSTIVRAELNKFREWRMLDFRTPFQDPNSYWKKAIEKFKVKYPNATLGIIISNGRAWEATAFPQNEAEMLALLKKYL